MEYRRDGLGKIRALGARPRPGLSVQSRNRTTPVIGDMSRHVETKLQFVLLSPLRQTIPVNTRVNDIDTRSVLLDIRVPLPHVGGDISVAPNGGRST